MGLPPPALVIRGGFWFVETARLQLYLGSILPVLVAVVRVVCIVAEIVTNHGIIDIGLDG